MKIILAIIWFIFGLAVLVSTAAQISNLPEPANNQTAGMFSVTDLKKFRTR